MSAEPSVEGGWGEEARAYYEHWTNRYLQTYGSVFQAFRTRNPKRLLRALIRSSGMGSEMRVLDAGCGIGGPAVFFAQRAGVEVDALTISPTQVELAQARVREAKLEKRIRVLAGDYHQLQQYYPRETFDLVLFLESLGHSPDPDRVLRESDAVLKPGGSVYIKDFFFKHSEKTEYEQYIRQIVEKVNRNYAYHVLDLEPLLLSARRLGWEIALLRQLPFATETSTRARFEQLFQVDNYGGMPEKPYADWLELRLTKPFKSPW